MRFQALPLMLLFSAIQAANASSSAGPTPSPSSTISLAPGCPTINPAGHQCGGPPHYVGGTCCVDGYNCCAVKPDYSQERRAPHSPRQLPFLQGAQLLTLQVTNAEVLQHTLVALAAWTDTVVAL
ncbi:hypothetical protein FRC05_001592 [Tulasnella sp. 425]|nr:hypothetical protein FRC05_001592 [Tulasnella sp. 425]